MNNTIGTKLKEARTSKGLTLQEVSDKVGCSPSYIHRIESGSRKGFNYQIYKKLTELLDIEDNEDFIRLERRSEFEKVLMSSKEARQKLKFTIDTAHEKINKAMDDLNLIEEELDKKIIDLFG